MPAKHILEYFKFCLYLQPVSNTILTQTKLITLEVTFPYVYYYLFVIQCI